MAKEAEPRIACIGWGSLIERPGCLATLGEWFTGGPSLPVEFARESNDGRITLVICPGVTRVPTRWVVLDQPTVELARRNLGYREFDRATQKWIDQSIGFWDRESATQFGTEAEAIRVWASENQLDGVVWTNLPCGFKGARGIMPSVDEVIAHLVRLDDATLEKAREYIAGAPAEVDTSYRRRISQHFNWGGTYTRA